jgi:3-oxosteroid 1-dehydrogenase
MVGAVTSWDREVDVLVAGSGAGGLSAALAAHDAGLDALVVEKAEHYGGGGTRTAMTRAGP